MTNKTDLLKKGLIGLSGAASAAIAGGVIAALALIPLPSYSGTPPQLSVTPDAGSVRLACPGALSIVSAEPGSTGFFSPGEASIQVYPNETSVQQSSLPLSGSEESNNQGFALALTDSAQDQQLGGSQFELSQTEDLSGAAAAACASAHNEFWLVGGSTEIGRTTLIVLTNPSDVNSQVTLETYDENGYIEQETSPIVVPAREQTIVALAGYLPESIAPVVRVQSVGGQITAVMQQSTTRTLAASGVDWVTPGSIPAQDVVITGVALTGQPDIDRDEIGDVVSDLEPTLRLLTPGDEEATVTVVVRNEAGAEEKYTAQLRSRQVVQLPLVVSEDGLYTVEVTADQPIVAGVRTVQNFNPEISAPVSSPGGDFTWLSTNLPLPEKIFIPVPESIDSYLAVFNPTDKQVSVIVSSDLSSPQTVQIPARGTQRIPLNSATNVTVDQIKGLYATVVYSGNGLGAAMPLKPGDSGANDVVMYPR